MDIRENILLAPYTTFKIGGSARYFAIAKSKSDIKAAAEYAKNKKLSLLVVGGGSNVLVSDSGFNGLVLINELLGINIIEQDNSYVLLDVSAGENWDQTVSMAVENNWWGIENLSHIPGKVGAFAVQNVGAYGQEASQVVVKVKAMNLITLVMEEFTNVQCKFSYRKSLFNSTAKGNYCIVSTVIRLNKIAARNLSYKDLNNYFEGREPFLQEIRDAVIEIRNKKFPFPTEAINGNAGSFFKNAIVLISELKNVEQKIREGFSGEVLTQFQNKIMNSGVAGSVKIPAAFLLEICGFKEVRVGGAAINIPQPLVILNATGHATAADVFALARQVVNTVKEKTGILLEIEPELVGEFKG